MGRKGKKPERRILTHVLFALSIALRKWLFALRKAVAAVYVFGSCFRTLAVIIVSDFILRKGSPRDVRLSALGGNHCREEVPEIIYPPPPPPPPVHMCVCVFCGVLFIFYFLVQFKMMFSENPYGCTSSVRGFPNVAFKTVPVLV